jgi:hypothetical protein
MCIIKYHCLKLIAVISHTISKRNELNLCNTISSLTYSIRSVLETEGLDSLYTVTFLVKMIMDYNTKSVALS